MIKEEINASRREVRKFGLLFAGLCAAATVYGYYKESAWWIWFAAGGAFFLLAGLFLYSVLRPVYIGWMKFAFVLAWINTRIILGLAFYLVVTPTGFLARLFGKEFLEEEFDRSARSYWKKRDQKPSDPSSYERMF